MALDYDDFKIEFLKLSGIDLNLYQQKQMKRRIDTLILRNGLSNYDEYLELISSNKDKLQYFKDYITISVSEFFRTKDQWDDMVEEALGDIVKRKKVVKAWSVACATGEEPYSLAISMKERYPENDIEIYATDIDDEALETARVGRFSPRQMESAPEEIRKKYFIDKGIYFEVCKEIKKKVKFDKIDLLKFTYPEGFDLILVRNVLIYFTKEAKDEAIKDFHQSLNEDGYLFTGNTEQIIYYKQMDFMRLKPYLYKKERRNVMDDKKLVDFTYGGKRTALIIEDNEINREILSSILEDEFNILTAENGQIGYEVLTENYSHISLILLDVFMPVMNGFEFLEKIKDDALLSSIPVIVTTASNQPEDEIKCLQLGASDFVTKPYNPQVVVGRIHSIIKLKESVATLDEVEYDSLTGLYTMPAFYHHASEILIHNPDKSYDLSVADIKDFKLINSYLGQNKGNELLKYIAERYKADTPEAIIARNGDKFYALYETKLTFSPEEGKSIYQNLINNAPIGSLTVKYGIYHNIDKDQPIQIICDRALMAAERIKNDFSKNMAFYDEKIEERNKENQKLEDNFAKALENKEFVAFYQPKVDTNSGKIIAGEALVRWIQNDKMISPGQFVPLFEKDGLITRLDEYIFKEVCEYQRRRMDEGKKVVPISINLSRNSIYTTGVGERYKAIVEELGIPAEIVPIEITESATTEGNEIIKLADELVRCGFSLHMDDFGTGYSSLSALADMPFDVLKLDKSLTDEIGNGKGDVLIEHVISIAQEMGMKVVAEGVEEKYQVEFLQKAGCDMIQGYYFSAPKNELAFSEMLDKVTNDELDLNYEYKGISAKTSINPELEIDDKSLKILEKIADEMLEGFLIYKATADETIIYANKALIKMFGCDSMEDFRNHTSNSFKGVVDKEDYAKVEMSIFNQINEDESNNDAVEYHIVRKDGGKLFVLDEGHCRYTKTYGNIFYVFIKER